MVPSMFGLWTYLFGVSNLKFDSMTAFAPKALYLDNDSNCFLFDGLQKCAYGNNEKQKETWSLISDIRSNILWNDNFTDDQRMYETFEKLHGFFVRHPEWLEERCANTVVHNGLTIQRFIEAGKMFKRMHNLKKILGGSPSLLIEYLSLLQEEHTLDATIREQIRMLVDNLNDYFVKEPRIFKRLEYVAAQTVELLNPQQSGAYIEIDLGTWGKFDDLLDCYAYYKKHGWHDLTETSAYCSSAQTLIRLRSDNHTILTDSIRKTWQKWSSLSYRADLKGYIKRIQNIVEGRIESLTTAQRLVEIARIFNGFRASGKIYDQLMEIELQNWGTIRQFCMCQQFPDNDLI